MSFFSKIEAAFKKVFGSSKWEQTAETTLTLVAPLLETLLALTAGAPAATAVGVVIAKIQMGLATAAKLSSDIKAGTVSSANGAQQLSAMLAAVQADLGTLLTATQIKDQTTQAKVTAIVDSISGEVQAIIAALPTPATAPKPVPSA